jgi:hypothetical protein
MFISLRQSVAHWSERFYRRRGGGIWDRQQATRRARNTVHRVVRMVRVRASRLDVRARIRTEPPFCQRGKCEKHLSCYQQTNRWQAECGWKDAGVAIKAHHDMKCSGVPAREPVLSPCEDGTYVVSVSFFHRLFNISTFRSPVGTRDYRGLGCIGTDCISYPPGAAKVVGGPVPDADGGFR